MADFAVGLLECVTPEQLRDLILEALTSEDTDCDYAYAKWQSGLRYRHATGKITGEEVQYLGCSASDYKQILSKCALLIARQLPLAKWEHLRQGLLESIRNFSTDPETCIKRNADAFVRGVWELLSESSPVAETSRQWNSEPLLQGLVACAGLVLGWEQELSEAHVASLWDGGIKAGLKQSWQDIREVMACGKGSPPPETVSDAVARVLTVILKVIKKKSITSLLELCSYGKLRSYLNSAVFNDRMDAVDKEHAYKRGNARPTSEFIRDRDESLDDTLGRIAERAYLDNTRDNTIDVDQKLDCNILMQEIFSDEVLTPRERMVLSLRCGDHRQGGMTFAEIGSAFGVSKERVKQIYDKAADKIRKNYVNPFLS
jgi:RNA polymerase sigma factor (sigma-70 family)